MFGPFVMRPFGGRLETFRHLRSTAIIMNVVLVSETVDSFISSFHPCLNLFGKGTCGSPQPTRPYRRQKT